jgi:acyl-CoA reductase-like NAD-dependent aldehyde dehydrogenase
MKPSNLTSLSTLAVAELALEAGLPPGVFNVVTGSGGVVGGAIARHPDVDIVSFTGGTETGMQVMRDRAEVGRRVQLELGGKSPTIVFEDADLSEVVPAAAFGIFMNQGQNCSAGSRILVQASVHDRFVAALAEIAAAIRVLPPFDPAAQQGALISGEHLAKVHGWVERAVRDGARIATGGAPLTGGPYRAGHFYPPTVLVDVAPDAAAFQEEIFGPVVTVVPFSDEAHAIQLANGTRYGLAASVWSGDIRRAMRVGAAIDTGFLWINTINSHPIEAPFGGVKDSGFGREEGLGAIENYMVQRSVILGAERFADPYAG